MTRIGYPKMQFAGSSTDEARELEGSGGDGDDYTCNP